MMLCLRATVLLLLLSLAVRQPGAQAQTAGPGWNWSRAITSPADCTPDELATDANGNTYVATTYQVSATLGSTTVPAGPTTTTGLVAKYSPGGSLLWTQTIAGIGRYGDLQLALDAQGNLLLAGFFYSSLNLGGQTLYAPYGAGIFTAKLNPQGQLRWLRLNSDQPGTLQDMGLDEAGNLYLSGSLSGRITFGALVLSTTNGIDQFVVKLDSAGVAQWGRQGGRVALVSGGPSVRTAYHALTVAPNGDCYLSWTMNTGAGPFGSLPAGAGFGAFDVALIKYDTQGQLRWMHHFGTTLDDWADRMAVDQQGHVLATMRFAGSFAGGLATVGNQTLTGTGIHYAALMQLDAATGTINWVRTLSADRTTAYRDVATDAAGNSYVAGSLTGSALFGTQVLGSSGAIEPDALVVSYSALGTPRWAQQSSSYLPEGADHIRLDATGQLVVAGYFRGLAQFGPTALAGPTANNPASGFVARLAQLPTAVTVPLVARGLALYPSPASRVVHLPLRHVGSPVQLIDVAGRVARETSVSAAGEVSVQGLAPGIYLLRTIDEQRQPYAGRLAVE